MVLTLKMVLVHKHSIITYLFSGGFVDTLDGNCMSMMINPDKPHINIFTVPCIITPEMDETIKRHTFLNYKANFPIHKVYKIRHVTNTFFEVFQYIFQI